MPRFKLVFFVPVKDTSRVLSHVFSKMPNDVGKIGQYESCAFMSRGTGQFKPGLEANPAIGKPGGLEYVEENKVEVVVNDKGANEEIRSVIRELKSVCATRSLSVCYSDSMPQVHPYEEVAYDVYRMEDF